MSSFVENKPVIGFTCGDINGIGIELLIKTLGDNRILDICTPIIFGNNKVLNFYRKNLPDINIYFFIPTVIEVQLFKIDTSQVFNDGEVHVEIG